MNEHEDVEELKGQESPDGFEKAFSEFASGLDEDDGGVTEDTGPEDGGAVTVADEQQEEDGDVRPDLDEKDRKIAELEHKVKSDAGRISAFQRKINELAQQKQTVAQEQPSRQDIADAMQTPEAWSAFAEEYPDIAEAVDNRLRQHKAEVTENLSNKFTSELDPIRKAEQDRFIQSQVAAIEAAHPDWDEVRNSSAFDEWVEKQPSAVQELRKSKNAADAVWMLNAFKRDSGVASPGSEEVPGSGQVAALKSKRLKQLAEGEAVQSTRRVARVSQPPDDFDQAFSAFADIKTKQRD